MAPVLLRRLPLLRFMASRTFFTPSSFRLHSSSSLPLSILSKPRKRFSLRKFSVPSLVSNGVTPRAYMSSLSAAEDIHKNDSSKAYGSDQIQVLEGLDPVRKRPGMYIGSTGPRGLHHLVYEILDNAVDEAQAGFASKIDVVLHADDSVSIADNGRGIPTDMHPTTKKSALETVLTILHAGGKFGGINSGYSVSGGLHGVGLSVVNALSEALEVTVWREGLEYTQTYSRGKPVTTLNCVMLPFENKDRQGTRIKFWPDKEVFTTAIEFEYNTIAGRIRELAFLNPKLTIALRKEDNDPEKVQSNEYFYAGGLAEYVQFLNTDKKAVHDVLSFRKEIDGITVDIALQWCEDAYSDTILGYANSIRTVDGGTHIDGMKASLTRTLNSLGKKSKVIKEKDITLSGEHVREGLTCVVSVKVPNPEFEGQTKTRLGNPEVRKVVDQSIQEYLTEYLELHPDVLDSVLSKALNAFKAALAAKRARELVRQKSVLRSSSLPGKLADCSSSNPEDCEIFIVEGDSAGGSAKQGRDRRFQAILPLRGKILNIERRDEAAMYKNEEIQNLILGLGLGVKGEDFKKDALRYHKIIILTDADVDGAHIRTLLLTFFYRYQRALFDEGYIYVGVPLIVTVPLSGGHMSPVFTFIAVLKGVVTLSRAVLYVLAQCIGSIIGFYILKCVMDPKLINTYSLGGCAIGGKELNSSINQHDALLLEFSCTFLVLFLGVTLGFDKKMSKNLGLTMVCLVIAGAMALAVFVSITVTGRAGYAGVGLNPARCLGAALIHGGSLWNGHWVFWVGPILACLIYYSISINLPKEGLVWVDGEYDVLKLALGSSGTIHNGDVPHDITIEGSGADFQEGHV